MGCFGIKSINKDLSPLLDLANFCCAEGAGEVIIYDVSSDGTRSGFNYDLFAFISCHLPIPTIALGGANTPDDVRQLFHKTEISGASIGSAFVFAPQTKEVLINYPHFKSQVFS
jgi:cyclase